MERVVKRMLGMALLGASLSGCAVRTADCWQLGPEQLAEARSRGWCTDAFARRIEELVPLGTERWWADPAPVPVVQDPLPGRKPKPPRPR